MFLVRLKMNDPDRFQKTKIIFCVNCIHCSQSHYSPSHLSGLCHSIWSKVVDSCCLQIVLRFIIHPLQMIWFVPIQVDLKSKSELGFLCCLKQRVLIPELFSLQESRIETGKQEVIHNNY
jgi:hypothetical protein